MGKAKSGIVLDPTELQEQVNLAEAKGPLPSLSVLWRTIASSEWGRGWGLTEAQVRARVLDPANVIDYKTKPGRKPPAPKTVAEGDIFEPFTSRGIKVNTLADIITSNHKTREQNEAIREVWKQIRLDTNNPAPKRGS